MQPRTQHQIIANAIRVFNRSGDSRRLKSKRCGKALYKMLYREMLARGINVYKVGGEIETCDIQEEFIPMFEQHCDGINNKCLEGYLKDLKNPSSIYHIYMSIINDQVYFEF